jgi:hypothetical protein
MDVKVLQRPVTAVISEDGKSVICISDDGSIRWARGAPLLSEWQLLAKRRATVDVENGRFQYVDDETCGQVVAVFTPYCGLDFNLTYAATTGDLMKIEEAR